MRTMTVEIAMTDEQWEELEEQASDMDLTVESWIEELAHRSLN